ncbi:xylose isomerase [Pseudothermotoga thermarum]|uniref:Xylose isomerase n=1 Tax=Pseudothermotoga thermarum DSM 5069 TaxID=688269 RepID=F7YUS3_9THEM|nr:xylose isomerase [Pseudothermotoga thermarum]AEH50260.1 D-xylose isomerase [Pseudothermotoga thermarum DSM 5069]
MKFFKEFPKIEYEGPTSTNPLSFKYYNPNEIIDGKSLKDHLKFSVAFWHTFVGAGSDMFGDGTFDRPWNRFSDPMDRAFARIDALIEFCEKLGIEYFCFHDRDIAPEGKTLRETNQMLDKVVNYLKERLKGTNLKLLWGTANLFSNPRYCQGAATSPCADVFAYAAAQVKKALEITKELGGQGYVFWGGREGYETLLNTDMKLELDNLARFLSMAVDYAKKIGFNGQFMIEPKPMEPTKHQYDFDAAHCLAFLKTYGLDPYFKFNIEANHATLAGHTFAHELRYARINGKFCSIDANQGDLMLGWDTDQYPTNIYETTLAMYEVIKAGGFTTGGLNFDAKPRRASYTLRDLVLGHIVAMDTFALGFKIAHRIIKDGKIDKIIEERYASYNEGIGLKIRNNQTNFEELEQYVLDKEVGVPASGRQEELEMMLNYYILTTVKC